MVQGLRKFLFFVLSLPVLMGVFFVSQAAAQKRTVWDGVFNQAQLARGEMLFAMNCARCHLIDLSGKNGPTLKGDRFMEDWREAPLEILFHTIRTMPPNNSQRATPPPQAFPDLVYLDIMTYILNGNGFPTGPNELTLDQLPLVQFEKKTGPEAVPNLALVGMVGCLSETTPGNWSLTMATDALRTMDPEQISAAEVKSAQGTSLGAKTFRLNQIDRLGEPIDPQKDKKVSVKGQLVRQSDQTQRLNITALAPVAASCN